MQVLSHEARSLALDADTCRKINDEAAKVSNANPKLIADFATVPMQDPAAACAELRRCTEDLNFVGALIDNTCEVRLYDDPLFWPFFEAAQELDE